MHFDGWPAHVGLSGVEFGGVGDGGDDGLGPVGTGDDCFHQAVSASIMKSAKASAAFSASWLALGYDGRPARTSKWCSHPVLVPVARTSRNRGIGTPIPR